MNDLNRLIEVALVGRLYNAHLQRTISHKKSRALTNTPVNGPARAALPGRTWPDVTDGLFVCLSCVVIGGVVAVGPIR